jgi:hypothetical protein
MSPLTKRLLLGSAGALALTVLLGVLSNVAFGSDDTGGAATVVWLAGTLCAVVTVGLLLGAAITAVLRRQDRPS